MTTEDFKEMTKKELETYGRTLGVELDRRQTKDSLINELSAYEMMAEHASTSDVEHEMSREQMDQVEHDPGLIEEVEALEDVFAPNLHDLPEPESDPIVESIPVPEAIDPEIEAQKIQEAKDFARMLHNMEQEVVQADTRAMAARISLEEASKTADVAEAHARKLRTAYEEHLETHSS